MIKLLLLIFMLFDIYVDKSWRCVKVLKKGIKMNIMTLFKITTVTIFLLKIGISQMPSEILGEKLFLQFIGLAPSS